MNSTKRQYLRQIRSNTAYPTYRATIGTIALLGYALAGLSALGALIAGFSTMSTSVLLGIVILAGGGVFAAAIYYGTRLWKEVALIIVDMGDGIADANAELTGAQPAEPIVA